MDFKEIKELAAFLEKSNLCKIHLKKEGFELLLEKQRAQEISPGEIRAPISTATAEKTPISPKEKEGSYVTAPMVGTFYAAASPDRPPFVKVGDRVKENTVVCIIEAMKVMNEVKAGVSGMVAEVLIDNGQPVEFGTKLFHIV